MKNLKLEHLSPYLPYKLKIQNGWGDIKTLNYSYLDSEIDDYIFHVKPILRPLSDLTKEIEINGEHFVVQKKLSHLDLEWLINSENLIMKTNYEDVLKLLSWHFDVFGLIDKGLAIDINTI